MKIFTVLLILLLVFIGLPLLASVAGAIFALVLPLAFLIIWFLPILIIACSDKTTGGEKLAWILAIVFLSWFAWIFYFLLAPIKPKLEGRRYGSGRYSSHRYSGDRYSDHHYSDHRHSNDGYSGRSY